MRDENCIFCKIANGEIPSATLYEDDDFRIILDLGPASRGHALLLPKEHYENLYMLPDELAAKALPVAKNVVQNNGETAGQTVFHFHMHLIPRYKGDQVGLGWKMGELTDEERDDILAKLREA